MERLCKKMPGNRILKKIILIIGILLCFQISFSQDTNFTNKKIISLFDIKSTKEIIITNNHEYSKVFLLSCIINEVPYYLMNSDIQPEIPDVIHWVYNDEKLVLRSFNNLTGNIKCEITMNIRPEVKEQILSVSYIDKTNSVINIYNIKTEENAD